MTDARLVPAAVTAWVVSLAVGLQPRARELFLGWAGTAAAVMALVVIAAVVAARVAAQKGTAAAAHNATRAAAHNATRAATRKATRAATPAPSANQNGHTRSATTLSVVVTAAFAVTAGVAAGWTAAADAAAHQWPQAAARPSPTVVTGTVTRVRETAGGDAWVVIDVHGWRTPAATSGWHAARGRVGLGGGSGDTTALGTTTAVGDIITVEGTLNSDAVGGMVAVMWEPTLLDSIAPTGWRGVKRHVRDAFDAATAHLPDATRGLVRGMVTGDTSSMPNDQISAMQASGLTHLTAVSGGHFAILAAAVIALARRARWARLWIALTVAAGAIILAATVTGGGSVARAVGSAVIVAVAIAMGRPAHALPTVAAVVTLGIVMVPSAARDVGFALSVAAVVAIGVLAPAVARALRSLVTVPLAQAFAITIAAQAACLPLLVGMGAQVGPWAAPANALAVPFAVPVTILGVIALALAAVVPGLAVVLVTVAGWCAWPVTVVARAFSTAPGSNLRWLDGVAGMVLALAACGALVVAYRWPRAAVLAHVALCVAAFVPGVLPPTLGGALRGWTVVACDVGQGDALVARAGGATIMIDVGARAGDAASCLRRLGVTGLDLIILTHDHADHVGALSDVVAAVPVTAIWLPPGASTATVAAAHQARAGPDDARVTVPAAPGTVTLVGDIEVTVLQTGPAPRTEAGTDVNDSSTVVHLAVGDAAGGDAAPVTVLALGDLEVAGQRRLAEALRQWPQFATVDLVKVAHHGSASQAPQLVEAITARAALISVGEGNTYGHPAPETVALFTDRAIPVVRTDQCGDIAVARVAVAQVTGTAATGTEVAAAAGTAPAASAINLVRPCDVVADTR